MKTWFQLTLIASVCGLVACGGGSNQETLLQGQFVDAPVEGLEYTSSSGISGVTDANGKFNYTAGSTVTFSLGSIKLPPVVPSSIVTPMDLVGATSPSDPAALAIARVLQSVDANANPEDGISVSKAKLKTGATAPSNWASMEDVALEGLLTSASDLVKKDKALDHFAKQLSKVNPSMSLVGRYTPGASTAGIAEIIAYHENSKSLFITVDHAAEPTSFKRVNMSGLSTTSIAKDAALSANNLGVSERYNVATDVNDANFTAGGVQSLDVSGNLFAIAVQNTPKTSAGVIAFYRLADNGTPTFLKKVTVGNLPDGVMFSPDGKYLVVANEGELNTDFGTTGTDPEGSISIIAINNGVPADTAISVGFADFNVGGSRHAELPATVRIGRPGATVAQDLEPEYVAFSEDGKTAFVTMQENNAVASVNVASGSINKIMALGFKDYATTYKIAASDRYASATKSIYENPTAAPTLKNYANLFGIYMPDGIATYTVGGKTYFLTANEGDDRTDFLKAQSGPNMPDSARFSSILAQLDVVAFPVSILDIIKTDQELGRLNLITKDAKGNFGDTDGDGDYDRLYVLGGRSFSVWDGTTGALVYDSGEDFERIVYSDASSDANSAALLKADGILGRLDNKGPEPETVVTGQVGNQTYAFIGLERSSGIMMYNITYPAKPKFVQYQRNSSNLTDGDISPEGMKFIPANKSPTGLPLLVVGYEVTGSLAVFQIK